MASSRTGTAKWKNLRLTALRRAKARGLKLCPECNVELDYKQGRTPASAEVDHILPYSKGGQDVIENCRVICRHCNQSLGGKSGNPRKVQPETSIPTSRQW